MAVMATSLCMVMSGSLGTPLSQPTGCNQGISSMFYLTLPQTTTPGCWARQDKGGWTSQPAFWFWPPVPGSNHLLLIDWLWLQIFDWLEHCSKPPPRVCLFARHEQPLGSGSCSQCSRACSQKSFLADSWHPLAIISYSPVHSQTIRCVFPSPVTPARSGCSCRHMQDTHTDQGHWAHTGWAVPVHCSPTSEVCLIHPAQETMTNNLQQPPHVCTKHRHRAGLASADSTCQQYLMSLFSHTSQL